MIPGIWCCSNPSCAGVPEGNQAGRWVGKLFTAPAETCDRCGSRVLEFLYCEQCGDVSLGGFIARPPDIDMGEAAYLSASPTQYSARRSRRFSSAQSTTMSGIGPVLRQQTSRLGRIHPPGPRQPHVSRLWAATSNLRRDCWSRAPWGSLRAPSSTLQACLKTRPIVSRPYQRSVHAVAKVGQTEIGARSSAVWFEALFAATAQVPPGWPKSCWIVN